ncbi:GGDEF domain-containing protein [Nisaea nitritireducens]|uniref:GGDEF domain-containing protein n=1 Tax=Nisaea nitritireducens TaxID=568392 RepID=UPI0018674EDA|nr:GGDEF domain-containing protein [Nisaea nitritireducens]
MSDSVHAGDEDGSRYGREYFSYVRGLFLATSFISIFELYLNFDWFLSVPLWLQVARIMITVIVVGYWLCMPRFDPMPRHAFRVGILFFLMRSLTLSYALEPYNVAFFYTVALIALMTLASNRYEVWAAMLIGAVSLLIARSGQFPDRAYLGLALVTIFAGYFGLSFLRFRERLFELLSQLKDQTRTDQLTGLKNRRALQDDIENGFQLLESEGTAFSLLLIDVDHFKRVNDIHGHAAGDEILKTLAREIRHDVRDMADADAGAGTVYRFGGEEFVVILPGTSVDGASIVAERLRSRIDAKQFDAIPQETLIPVGGVTISVGIAGAEAGSGWSEVYSAADLALYRAKDLGRNRVERADRPTPFPASPELVFQA